jgi:signal transduction histidine kinase
MDAWLTQLYERHRGPYVWLLLGAAGAFSLVSTGLNIGILQLYAEWRAGDFLRVLALAGVLDLLGLAAGLAIWGAPIWRLIAWIRAGEPADGSIEARDLAIQIPIRVVPKIAVLIMLFEILAVVYGVRLVTLDASPVVIFIGTLEAVAAAALFGLLILEQGLRPIARSAQRRSGIAGLAPPGASVSLRGKLLVGLPIVSVMTAYVAVVLANQASTPGARLSVGIGAALLVTLTVSLVLTATLTRSLSEPVSGLLDATARVERGDLAVSVAPLSGDELGVLAGRFNQMLAGLRERESLREENVELVDDLRASRARVVAAADASRQEVERDLHDGAQQYLVLLDLKLGLLERKLAENPEAQTDATAARADLQRALEELRDLAHGIYPAVLTSDGLPAALEAAAEEAAIPTSVACDGAGRYPDEIEAAVYFCCLEALQNAAKYAGPDARATVSLSDVDGILHFEVADDGTGFDPASINGSAGLQNMEDRIGALGGELQVESEPGRGTRVVGRVPLGA